LRSSGVIKTGLVCALVIMNFTACMFKYKPLPPDAGFQVKEGSKIELNLTGKVKGVVFEVEEDSIRRGIMDELKDIFPNAGTDVAVIADVRIEYKYKISPYFLGWPFIPFGAPAGKHMGEAEIVLRVSGGQTATYKGVGKVEKLSGLYYNWKYDPPFEGGILRYAVREALNAARNEMARSAATR
jgi:hypothetical protein